MKKITKIKELFEANRMDDAIEIIQQLIIQSPNNESLYFWLGKIHYKKQEWGAAINAFNKVLEINPDNQEAKSQADMANAILGYFTPDMFNP